MGRKNQNESVPTTEETPVTDTLVEETAVEETAAVESDDPALDTTPDIEVLPPLPPLTQQYVDLAIEEVIQPYIEIVNKLATVDEKTRQSQAKELFETSEDEVIAGARKQVADIQAEIERLTRELGAAKLTGLNHALNVYLPVSTLSEAERASLGLELKDLKAQHTTLVKAGNKSLAKKLPDMAGRFEEYLPKLPGKARTSSSDATDAGFGTGTKRPRFARVEVDGELMYETNDKGEVKSTFTMAAAYIGKKFPGQKSPSAKDIQTDWLASLNISDPKDADNDTEFYFTWGGEEGGSYKIRAVKEISE